jgi:hypothetical protein
MEGKMAEKEAFGHAGSTMLWATFRTCSRPRLISLPLQGFHDFAEFASGDGDSRGSLNSVVLAGDSEDVLTVE